MKMTRRELIEGMGVLTLAGSMRSFAETAGTRSALQSPTSGFPMQLAGTDPFTMEGDIAARMVAGIHADLLRRNAASIETRHKLWSRDFLSTRNYEASVTANRERFKRIIGLIDDRDPFSAPGIETRFGDASTVAANERYKVYSVRWPVFAQVDAAGLLLEPAGAVTAQVVALPDADWSPEMLVGIAPGIEPEGQFARRLAENGCRVLIPALIDRQDTWSGNERLGIRTNLTHREFIYRMAYQVGRHVIGYEVQKVLAAVDWFAKREPKTGIGVIGYGEGALLALYSSAVDTRINAACVSGYFTSRQDLWQEPLYRNVWSLLQEFGDAEIASLIAPRSLIIEASRGPEIAGPPRAAEGQFNSAASGRLVSPELSDVRAEVDRARPVFAQQNAAAQLSLVASTRQALPGSPAALSKFLHAMGVRDQLKPSAEAPVDTRAGFDPGERLHRQFAQLVEFTQHAVIESENVRSKFWQRADRSSVELWRSTTKYYRDYLWEEVFGKLPDPPENLQVQTRRLYEQPNWTGYEVFLPMWDEVFAYGILLVPNALEPNERRPVVVCQHGLEEKPQDVILGDSEGEHYNHNFAADLADHGFVVYCPQNPYRGGDNFRRLQRLANPLKYSLYSFILSQSERTLKWLATQPFVDASRIGFYGLSYGGKTAMRVPPLLDEYALSICSGDFNEWIWKTARSDEPFTYCFTREYEVCEFNLGNTFNHSDMANLMTPRYFMVERGHNDSVSLDSWVAYEYAKVQRHYELLGLYDQTRIEYFNGPHGIHGVGTFDFLHKALNWGEPSRY